MISFEFYGTSHGEGYGGVIKGLPNGFTFSVDYVNKQLELRKTGYGRSARQAYPDKVEFKGFADKVTVNGNLEFFVPNAKTETRLEITALRAGHIDLVGQARYPDKTVRELNELYSARSSVCYVVLGAICKQYLESLNITTSHTVVDFDEKRIDEARAKGDSLGGSVIVTAQGVPVGTGQALPYHERLDAVIAANLMGIPSVKGVSFGLGDAYVKMSGVECSDKLIVKDGKIEYATNNCGGIVAGISTGRDIVCNLIVKPVPTVKGVKTVDYVSLTEAQAHYERADTCVVSNVGVIAENILAYVLLNQLIKQGKVNDNL